MGELNSQGCDKYHPLAYDIMDEDFHNMMEPVVCHVLDWSLASFNKVISSTKFKNFEHII